MTEQTTNSATVLFERQEPVDLAALGRDLARPLRNIALEFDEVAVSEDSHLVMISEAMILRVRLSEEAPDRAALAAGERPERARADAGTVEALIGRVQAGIEVSASDGHARALPRRVRLAACYHVVRHLIRTMEPALVHWHLGDTLFTPEEFETPPAMPAGAGATAGASAARMSAGEQPEPEIARTHERLDQQAAAAMQSAMASTESRLREARRVIFANDLIETTDRQRARPRDVGLMEQLSVYVMTVTLMVLAFPVGFAMLVYTVLRGENLTVTARAMALTGVGMGLTGGELANIVNILV